jgi:hypothetical protein
MKTRNGFVSNSSSSSFVCVVRKEDHEKILSELSEKEKSLISGLFKESSFAGIPVVLRGDLTDPGGCSVDINGNTSDDYEDDDDETANNRYEAEEKYEKVLRDNKIETLSASFDL